MPAIVPTASGLSTTGTATTRRYVPCARPPYPIPLNNGPDVIAPVAASSAPKRAGSADASSLYPP
ncbi:MAG: hypothetical protein KJ069_28075 [Anaerolineae bacterium]|nr:hypothetical protein [Anaerolineae bacterium]